MSERRPRLEKPRFERLQFEKLLLAALGTGLVVLLVAPLVALVVKTPPSVFWTGLFHPLVWAALKLSAVSTCASLVLVLVFGTPLAWLLSQSKSRWCRWLETALLLPMVIPPAVSGITLLLAFGRRGLFTAGLGFEDTSLAFTSLAVVIAQVFVSAPYYVQAATTVFRRLDENVLLVARTLGARPLRLFSQIAVPLAASGLVPAAAVSWARALGEFGATLMFAGNQEGVTQTLPLAIYVASESDMRAAQSLSLVLVVVAFGVLFLIRRDSSRSIAQERSDVDERTGGQGG
jgi:molybdate transport system permease protein